MELKLVISDPKTGKSLQRELQAEAGKALKGLKVGDSLKGELIGMAGYEFTITGGSDSAGFPMRNDAPGTGRKRILAVKGVGVSNKKKYRGKDKKGMRTMEGMKQRKTVAGNTIYPGTAQVNVTITKAGKENLFAEKPAEGEAPKEEAKQGEKAEAPKEEEKEKTAEPEKKEEKKEEPKENKEAKKEKPKAEEKTAEKKEDTKQEKAEPESKKEGAEAGKNKEQKEEPLNKEPAEEKQ